MGTFDEVVLGRSVPLPTPEFPGIHDALVVSATETDLRFTIVGWADHLVFGPAPYVNPIVETSGSVLGAARDHHHHTAWDTDHNGPVLRFPPPGTSIVVAFVGNGIDRPRVLAIYGWPT